MLHLLEHVMEETAAQCKKNPADRPWINLENGQPEKNHADKFRPFSGKDLGRHLVYGIQETASAIAGYFTADGRSSYTASTYSVGVTDLYRTRTGRNVPPSRDIHTHSFYELTYVVKGSFGYDFPEGSVMLGEGECLLMNTAAIHRDRFSGEESCAVFLSVNARHFDQLAAKELSQCSWADLAKGPGQNLRYLRYRPRGQSRRRFEDALAMAVLERAEAGPEYEKVCEIMARRALGELDRCFLPERETLHGNVVSRDIFLQIDRHIERNLATVTLASLSDEFHFNPRYYNQVIKRQTGMTLTEYIQQKRIAAAKQMLEAGDEPVLSVMNAVGYRSTEYFYRLFQADAGMTPAQYRMAARTGAAVQ